MMAGWASFNKYSLLGALRAAAQAISYEIPLTLSVVGVIILAGTMSLNSIVEQQAGSFLDWNVWKQPLGLIIFFIAAIAEANRTPLDMTEADQELVAGFATEYSGMRFGFFFFAEYVNVFVVSALTVVLFFGGWNAPFDWPFPVDAGPRPGEPRHRAPLRRRARAGGRRRSSWRSPFWLGSSTGSRPSRPWSWASSSSTCSPSRRSSAGPSSASTGSSGLVWMMAKTYVFVFIFVQMRATFPRVRVDQLMGFAWKWLLPAALINIFVTAIAVSILANR